MGGSMGYRLAEQGKLVNLYEYFDKYPALADRLPGTYFWYGKDKTFGTQTANEVMLTLVQQEGPRRRRRRPPAGGGRQGLDVGRLGRAARTS